MHALNAHEARALLEVAHGDRLEALLVLALATGARRGELLGLTWRDLDLDRGSIAVRFSLVPTTDGLTLMEPKTQRSRRRIEVEPRVVAVLRRHRAAQEMERRVVGGSGWDERGFVFCNTVGSPLDGHYVSARWFPTMLAKAGLPRVRFHDLRHTYASIALAAGVHPKIVQETLGHSTIAVTLDLYSHVVPTLQRDAARTMADALFG